MSIMNDNNGDDINHFQPQHHQHHQQRQHYHRCIKA